MEKEGGRARVLETGKEKGNESIVNRAQMRVNRREGKSNQQEGKMFLRLK